MNTRFAIRDALALVVAACAAVSSVHADHFRALPLDEGAGHTHYRIIGESNATILTLRTRAEYASIALRARDVAYRLNQAVDNLHEHEGLYFEIQWEHERPVIHQVSRDGLVHFMIVAVGSGDAIGARQREGIGDMVMLARAWLDQVDAAVQSAGGGETEETIPPAPERPQGPEGAAGPGQERGRPRRSARIHFTVDPPDSSLYLDDSLLPDTIEDSIQTTPGKHTLEAVYPGYRPFRQEIQLEPGQEISVEIKLEKEAPKPER